MNTLLATKSEMTNRFDKNGKRLTITVVTVKNNTVIEKKETSKAGYNGIVLGIGSKKKASKALLTKLSTIGTVPLHIKEVRSDEALDIGTSLSLSDVFKIGDLVKVTGDSKGRGFTGVVKRYNFRGGPKTHGQSDRHRAPGSLGSGTTPGRVFRGKRMAGRSGGEQYTVRNLIVAHINNATNQMLLTGPVPGHVDSLLTVTKIGESPKFPGIELLQEDIVAVVPVEVVETETVEAPVAEEVVVEEVKE